MPNNNLSNDSPCVTIYGMNRKMQPVHMISIPEITNVILRLMTKDIVDEESKLKYHLLSKQKSAVRHSWEWRAHKESSIIIVLTSIYSALIAHINHKWSHNSMSMQKIILSWKRSTTSTKLPCQVTVWVDIECFTYPFQVRVWKAPG